MSVSYVQIYAIQEKLADILVNRAN